MKKRTQLWISGITGIVFIFLILILAVVYPCPTSSQYNIFRIIISIAIAAFSSIIPGLFEYKYKEVISAAGALAVFAFVYKSDPAKLIVSDDCSSDLFVSGTVLINGKETKNTDVRIMQLKRSTVTDEYGAFKIEYPKKDEKSDLDFRVTYNTSLDTSFNLATKNWHDLKLSFTVDNTKIAVNPTNKPEKPDAIKVPTQISKKEIQNYFVGELPASSVATYGGSQYCVYTMKYTNLKFQLKLTKDRKGIQLAKISFRANENSLNNCPYQATAPNTHIYDLSTSSISGENIFLTFAADPVNYPLCSLTFEGVIENNFITGTLYSERINNMAEPKLMYKIKMDVRLEITE